MDKKASEWINYLWNQSETGFLCLDLSARVLAINEAGATLFGIPPAKIIDELLIYFLDTFSREKAWRMLIQTQEEGSVEDWELDIMQQEALPKLVGFTTTLIRDENNQSIGYSIILRDLTQQTQLTAQLAQVNQELEGALLKLEKAYQDLKTTQLQLIQSEKMRSLGQMVAGVAHEINNPIGFINNNLVYLQDKIQDLLHTFHNDQLPVEDLNKSGILPSQEKDFFHWQDIVDAIDESLEGVDRVKKIVLALRNFSRLDEAEYKQADIIEGLQSTIQIVMSSFKERIQFIEQYQPIPEIPCNPSMLNQVFMNLLVNSAQAIKGSGKIFIRTRMENSSILVEIEDNGAGMAPAELIHLGEPFYTTKPVGSGTGLGLAISYGIIERHNGIITFESEPGKGTVARIKLPINP